MTPKEPLHIVIRKYRVMPIALTLFFVWITIDMWFWYKANHQLMEEWSIAGFISLMLFAGGAVKWSLENFMKKIEIDEHDKE